MNDNETNAPIKLPVRYDATKDRVYAACDTAIARLDELFLSEAERLAIGNQIVTALNESDALRAEVEAYRTSKEEDIQRQAILIALEAGEFSESQCCKAFGMIRVDFRDLRIANIRAGVNAFVKLEAAALKGQNNTRV